MVRRPGRRRAGVAAARRQRLRLRRDVPAGGLRADVRRDGPGRKAQDEPPRGCVREAGRVSSSVTDSFVPSEVEGRGAESTTPPLDYARDERGLCAPAPPPPLALYIHWPFC